MSDSIPPSLLAIEALEPYTLTNSPKRVPQLPNNHLQSHPPATKQQGSSHFPPQASLCPETGAMQSYTEKYTGGKELATGAYEKEGDMEELILQLRIRVAVLENELKHKERERDEAVSACGTVVRYLGSSSGLMSGSGGTVMEDEIPARDDKLERLEQEVQKLKRENAVLWARIESRELGRDVAHLGAAVLGLETTGQSCVKEDSIPNQVSGEAKGKGKMVDADGCSRNMELVSRDRAFGLSPQHPKNQGAETILTTPTKLEKSTSSFDRQKVRFTSDDVDLATAAWGKSMVSGSTTVPNSPVPPAVSSSYAPFSSKDVGFQSLDEILGPEGSDQPPPPGPITAPIQAPQVLEEGPGIDEEVEEQMKAMTSLEDLPIPTVLKTGFDLKGSFRGQDYDYSLAPRDYKNFNRFTSSHDSRSSHSRHISMSNSSFETPKTFNGVEDIWSSPKEREAAINIYLRHSDPRDRGKFADFFQYGICYVPSGADSNHFRTILISNLPMDTELRDVLARVRGGEIVSANLLDTEKLTGSKTALVQFLNDDAVEAYLFYTQTHAVRFGSSKQKAHITLVTTPTWPLTAGTLRCMIQLGQTRCLAIPNFSYSSYSLDALKRDLEFYPGFHGRAIVDLWLDEQQTLHLQYASVRTAGSAYGILSSWNVYRQLKLEVFFTPDPCAGSVEELELPLPQRSPMLLYTDLPSPGNLRTESRSERQGGERVSEGVLGDERKKSAALANQRVEIPSFAGERFTSSSWADEVIEEAEGDSGDTLLPLDQPIEYPALLPNTSAQPFGEKWSAQNAVGQTVMMENLNQVMASKEHGFRKPPIGLAGSKYASLVPGFEDLPSVPQAKKLPIGMALSSDSEESPTSKDNEKSDTKNAGAAGVQPRAAFPRSTISSSPVEQQGQTAEDSGLRTPPRVNLESLLQSSPSASLPSPSKPWASQFSSFTHGIPKHQASTLSVSKKEEHQGTHRSHAELNTRDMSKAGRVPDADVPEFTLPSPISPFVSSRRPTGMHPGMHNSKNEHFILAVQKLEDPFTGPFNHPKLGMNSKQDEVGVRNPDEIALDMDGACE
ncbi:hypothetical protein M430DRAFT_20744 [Amorphotheca resinae ATCC 22711]|uniref:RRM domain-containing protein n=1 Tax=Amorphotheca resinae ATCC 22711 TaxID=857342 RepID=A0A2T3AVZ9_AMORE|nr:hypothetical protein M430DRAFT_20744 [Amorphotheca resinae ATCC 22711]PSS12829.1 hypothetical protein M430DRAFT_20744 [Amorphotheca resinae ATCC 22711]